MCFPRITHMIKWAESLGRPECPYIKRWVFSCPFFSLRLHHWLASDDQRHYHDHPWWYVTLILKGGYIDRSPKENIVLVAGDFAFRKATHQHTVEVAKGGCWSLLFTGPEKRVWGFWVNGKFKKRNKYFWRHGHHPCEK